MQYGIIKLTQGNITNNHFYLNEIIELFPDDVIGGSSEIEVAVQMLEIYSGLAEPIITDIAGDKKIFRKRKWVREFFNSHSLKAGDFVVVERISIYKYHVYPQRSV